MRELRAGDSFTSAVEEIPRSPGFYSTRERFSFESGGSESRNTERDLERGDLGRAISAISYGNSEPGRRLVIANPDEDGRSEEGKSPPVRL